MTEIVYDRFYIGGDWVQPLGDSRIRVVSPTTEEEIGAVPGASEADVDRAVAAARRAFDRPDGWSRWEPYKRAEALDRFADALEKRGAETARRVSAQNGMPIWTAELIEKDGPAGQLRYNAELIRQQPQLEERPGVTGAGSLLQREPMGVVAAIPPWNVPQNITFMKLAPGLAAGCTFVLKPSPETVLDAFLMAEAADEAGLPPGVINVVPGGRDIGEYLVAHPDIDKVSFTGSTAAGKKIAAVCGSLLRPVTLELGGKSAAIVLDDAQLESSLDQFFVATMLNQGQVCFLCTRILVPRSRYSETLELIAGWATSLRIGDPLDSATQIGPMVSEAHRRRVEGYISAGIDGGATLVAGGGRPDLDKGWFVQPTVFGDVDNRSIIAQEEIFGPVLAVIPYDNEEHAIALANDSNYGLGGTVWTQDAERGLRVAKRVATGTMGVNGHASDLNVPFGGIKSSGIGREMGLEALHSYQNMKAIFPARG